MRLLIMRPMIAQVTSFSTLVIFFCGMGEFQGCILHSFNSRNRLLYIHLIICHEEVNERSSMVAAETIEGIGNRIDMKGGCLVFMIRELAAATVHMKPLRPLSLDKFFERDLLHLVPYILSHISSVGVIRNKVVHLGPELGMIVFVVFHLEFYLALLDFLRGLDNNLRKVRFFYHSSVLSPELINHIESIIVCDIGDEVLYILTDDDYGAEVFYFFHMKSL